MTDELTLHDTDREAWLGYVAPQMARRIATEPDGTLADTWSRIPRDYQKAVWQHLDETQRERVRRIAKERVKA